MRKDKHPAYEERYLQFAFPIEKLIIFIVICLFLLLLASQLVLQLDSLRFWFVEVERLEGVAS
jgi:ABC-type uncharacterized transport system permease subunit